MLWRTKKLGTHSLMVSPGAGGGHRCWSIQRIYGLDRRSCLSFCLLVFHDKRNFIMDKRVRYCCNLLPPSHKKCSSKIQNLSPCCNLLPPSHKKCSSKIQNLSPKKASISLSNIQLSPSLSSSTYHRFLCTKWIFFWGTEGVLSYITTVLKIVTRVNQKRKEYTPSVLKYNVF